MSWDDVAPTMKEAYKKQVALLLDILPSIACVR
jgi:hypothetical protein